MITASPSDLSLVAGDFAADVRVDVYGPDDAWHNLSNFLGYDWIVEVQFGESIDQMLPTATIVLAASNGTISLQPGMTASPANNLSGSFNPLLEFGRRFRIYDSLTAIGASPSSWNLRWDGKIDSIARSGAGEITITGRIFGTEADTWIDTVRPYGSDSGVDMEDTIQAILDDNLSSPPTLYVPASPAFLISPAYAQEEGLLLEQCKNIAMLKGWDLRPKWSNVTGQWELTLIDPGRAGGSPVATITPSQYIDITAYEGSLDNVRNKVRVQYYDASNETEIPDVVWAEDAASIAEYGERFIGVIAAPSIDSESEAQDLADAILADLSNPLYSKTIDDFYWPWVQLRDIIKWTANGVHYDVDQNLAVVGYTHSFTRDGKARTKFMVRGSPIGAYGSWLRGRGISGDDAESIGSLQIYDVQEIGPSDATQKTLSWKVGSLVHQVSVYYETFDDLASGFVPWDNLGSVRSQLVSGVDDQKFTFPVPTSRRLTYVRLVPESDDPSVTGAPYETIIQPAGGEDDRIISLSVTLDHSTGGALVRIEVPFSAKSYRYDYAVGTPPTGPDDGEVEGGSVRTPSSGVDTFSLPPDTVGVGETVRVRAVAYTGNAGLGADGTAADHGSFISAEAERTKFRPAKLRTTTFDESAPEHGVTLSDPDGVATELHFRTKEGNDPPGAWTLKTDAPGDGVEYLTSLTLVEGHLSFVEWRLTGVLGGKSYYDYLTSPGFDYGTIPNPTIIPRIYEDTNSAGAAVAGDGDQYGVKILCRKDRNPTLVEIQAATTIVGRNIDAATIGNLITGLENGDPLFYGAIGIGIDGQETPSPVYTSAVFGSTPPVIKKTTELETTNIGGDAVGRFGVTVLDPSGQADLLEYQVWLGNELVTDWTTKANPPASGVEYVEDVVLEDGAGLGWVKYRLTYTRYGTTLQIFATSRGFDYGNLPTITIIPSLTPNGALTATVITDSDTKYSWIYWVLVDSEYSEPDAAFIKANAQFEGTTKIWTPSILGTITTMVGNDIVKIFALGHTAVDGISGTDGPVTPVNVEFGGGPTGETGNYLKVSTRQLVPGAVANKLYPQALIEVGPDTTHIAYAWTDPITGDPDPGTLDGEVAVTSRIMTITIPTGYESGNYPPVVTFVPWNRDADPDSSGLSKTVSFPSVQTGPEGVFRFKSIGGSVAAADYLKAVAGSGVDFNVDSDGRPYPVVKSDAFMTISGDDPVSAPADATRPHLWLKKST